ncbi:hypothetical protein JMJ77_0011910 [Colletotrichum scovillei]|uniref:Uncharacterized protein n=1 Tax=Colletotrichum scovillei TaxID=1209932 RepID=A0A9P7QVS9_9PEZI|nr:hypothetical protein JMJ77_0011910 [Colletotrichum scovillei]KAG7046195.1 hypothetical protein JMJ78_0011261 [Colletotrichum scovillei]KAG7063542.1 hypothetical protein JMJ76_0006005 [Colletotrichum scovillei]
MLLRHSQRDDEGQNNINIERDQLSPETKTDGGEMDTRWFCGLPERFRNPSLVVVRRIEIAAMVETRTAVNPHEITVDKP